MICYVKYAPETGEVMSSGMCSETDFDLLTDVITVDNSSPTDNHYVLDGSLVEIPAKGNSNVNLFNYTTHTWEFDTELAFRMVRKERDYLLRSTDWTQLPDVPENIKAMYLAYRSDLRDITDQPIDYLIFPIPPT